MCGLAGVFLRRPGAAASLRARAEAMAAALAHRGPDGSGVFVAAEAGLALAHRRLAVIDLTPGGAQPMRSACGRYALTYNGELYDYREHRAALRAQGVAVAGESDTAVLLAALSAWGVEAALPRFDAMFAFAFWDGGERTLWLARDHAGVKPLYWAECADGTILFGSELRALAAAGGLAEGIDPQSATLFLRLGYVPSPRSILAGVRQVPPGGLVRIPLAGPIVEKRWFDLVALARETPRATLSATEAAEAVDAELERSVRRQLIADVPLGAFLSGGVDSSSVVAAMARAAPAAAHAFTIGFADRSYDESNEASAIARALGIRHTVLRATEADALSLAVDVGRVFDEPFADPSAIPTLLLCRLARGHVTVALSGDGGDELFGGYRRHLFAHRHWPRLARLPLALRRPLAALLAALPERFLDVTIGRLAGAPRRPGETVAKIARVLGARDLDEAYGRLAATDGAPPLPRGLPDEPLLRFRAADAAGYLPDDVLTKVDRAAMSVALEVRVPILSPAMIRLAFSLPSDLLVRADGGKAVLRDALARHVPRRLFEREKTGFSPPLAAWLRGPLRDWAADLLRAARLRTSGLVDPVRLDAAWAHHAAGRDRSAQLWPALMLSAWLEARATR